MTLEKSPEAIMVPWMRSKEELKKAMENDKWDIEFTKGIEISKDNWITVNFDLWKKYAGYTISYTTWGKGEITLTVFGNATYSGVSNKETDKSLKYKNISELKTKLNNDLTSIISEPILWEKGLIYASPNTEEKIYKKINLTSRWIIYEIEKKTDIKKEWKNIIINLDSTNKIKIETEDSFFWETYRLIINKNKKIELEDDNALIFANNIRKNLPNNIKKDKDTSYIKFFKAYQLLEK